MTRTIRLAIAAIIFVSALSLTTFAQSSAWTRMMNQGISNVNDVDVTGWGEVWITKTDGTIWRANNDQSNFVQMAGPAFAHRIGVSDDGALVFITTNDGRLFYQYTWERPPIWRQINRPSFVNDVALPHFNFNNGVDESAGRLWISESFLASSTYGVVSYTDLSWTNVVGRPFNGLFTSTVSSGLSRVSVNYANQNSAWGVGFDGTVSKYDGNSWTRIPSQGMSDITDGRRNKIWFATKQQFNGTIWCSPDNGLTFRQDVESQGFKNLTFRPYASATLPPTIYAAGYNGTLWKRSLAVSPCP